MDRDTARARIQFNMSNRTSHAAQIVLAMQDAQLELEKMPDLPWFLKQEISSITTTADEERVPVPTDFLREFEEDALYYFDSAAVSDEQWTVLFKESLDFLRDKYSGSGKPEGYALDGQYFRLFPTPDLSTYTLKMVYYYKDTILTSNVENQWLLYAPRLIIGKAGVDIGAAIGDKRGMDLSQKIYNDAFDVFERDQEARRHVGRRYVMGGAD